jgi:hypothetical protein
MIVLYRSTLLSSDTGDVLPMIQYKSLTFRSICFLSICCVHVSLKSQCRPRYFAVGDCGIAVLFMCTAGHCSFFSVKVTCTDLVTLMLIRHFFSQATTWSRWPCSLCEAVTGSSWRPRMTVSSPLQCEYSLGDTLYRARIILGLMLLYKEESFMNKWQLWITDSSTVKLSSFHIHTVRSACQQKFCFSGTRRETRILMKH